MKFSHRYRIFQEPKRIGHSGLCASKESYVSKYNMNVEVMKNKGNAHQASQPSIQVRVTNKRKSVVQNMQCINANSQTQQSE